MSGPYKMCRECNAPGEMCNDCPLEKDEEEDTIDSDDSIPDTPMLVTCASSRGDVTGRVVGKEL